MSVGLWALSVVAWGVSWLLDLPDLGRLSLILCGAAVTVTIKGMFVCQRQYIRNVVNAAPSARGALSPLH